ncbi:vacuolar protein sorting-associated protein VTA1 homolog [Homalodisca vitripennis]|uniref:vacuolar protein sorting-associated protein VTA1 homolog n=1 Tax=Homalodisca vitripennis TaxID=197043 RepID=UPI001EEA06C6|nr:vacuolar protein sorting-associated protein VTA1 homolog [Homalodisca vitripennis]
MSVQLPPCPASLRPIQHYLKTASEHDGRDSVISYWCRVYALQCALKIDKKSDEARLMLVALMDWLEKEKKKLSDNEAITNDIAAQAHIENYALKLFLWADGQDRAGQFNKNVVKAFYTAGFLMDVLSTFGEQTDEIQQNCKYAKWKAAYIHNCLRNGEIPVPGPVGGDEGGVAPGSSASQPNIGFEDYHHSGPTPSDSSHSDPSSNFQFPTPPSVPSSANFPTPPGAPSSVNFPTPPGVPSTGNFPNPPSGPNSFTNLPTPASRPAPSPSPSPVPSTTTVYNPATDSVYNPSINGTGVKLQPDQISKAQKYCKWAGSALNYDDVPEAISNLQKALKLLTTGEDS